ncbi:MAG: hypothetical protein R2801_07340 [Chitinophagales bacterium]
MKRIENNIIIQNISICFTDCKLWELLKDRKYVIANQLLDGTSTRLQNLRSTKCRK